VSADGIPVLLRDAHLLAVAKPAGRLVIPGRVPGERSLREELEAAHGPLFVVHRLDRNTSGVLLLARTPAAHRALNLAFDGREVRKTYLALVRGAPPDALRCEAAIAAGRKGRMRAAEPGDPRGKPSATAFELVERFASGAGAGGPLALVRAHPETGRTHQIRVHLAHAGFPLAVDPDYGDEGPLRTAAGRVLLARTPLHAARLELAHPAGGGPVVIEAPLAEDLAGALRALRA
jgi:tRNA pseudouridine32 synthase/23S rRNA pseudouridine746 synthase